MDKPSDEVVPFSRPLPTDFANFMTWACLELQLPVEPIIIRTQQDDYCPPTASGRTKERKAPKEEVADAGSDAAGTGGWSHSGQGKFGGTSADENNAFIVNIQTVFDSNDHLVQLKFLKNLDIPRALLKIITLIAPFYTYLTAIYIDRGLTCDGLYEINKIVTLARVTEITLDNTSIPEANYYLLLEENCPLKYLSLARCGLDDNDTKAIAERLVQPYAAANTLSVLNLPGNMITDLGAQYLADALKLNRQVSYLNLAGNLINDAGAESILNSLIEFPLKPDDVTDKRRRHLTYLKDKQDLITRLVKELRSGDFDKKSAKKKPVKLHQATSASSAKKSKAEREASYINTDEIITPGMEAMWLEKAEAAAEIQLGPFKDAFRSENVVTKDGIAFCLGNNALCYLSLAYNNLTYTSVKKLCEVLSIQEDLNRKPRGLINVCIEGNNVPESCSELTDIDFIIESGLAATRKLSMMIKKKGPPKPGAR